MRFGQQLVRLARVAHLVRVFAKEAPPHPADMKPGAHPVAGFWRGRNRDGTLDRNAADSSECIRDDVRFERHLARIGDMGVHASAAERIGSGIPPVSRGREDPDRGRKRQPFLNPFDADRHTLARNRSRDKKDLPIVPRDHPPAGRWFFDRRVDLVAGGQHFTRMQDGQAERVAQKPLKGGDPRTIERLLRHPRDERRQLRLRFTVQRRHDRGVGLRFLQRRLDQLAVERLQPIDNHRAPVAARCTGVGGQMIELAYEGINPAGKLCTPLAAAPQGRQPRDGAFDMRGKWRLAGRRLAAVVAPPPPPTPIARRQSSKRSRMSASQNSIRTGRRRGPFA